ncbi:MAG: BON domain-containing protein [Desulfobacterales bacterium]
MSMTGLDVFDRTLQKTNEWLNDIGGELGFVERRAAYGALRAVLQGLRDCLTVDEAAHFGAQLPMLIRGLYYEGWRPAHKPVEENRRDHILSRIRQQFAENARIDPVTIARGVFEIIFQRITQGEMEDIVHMLPKEIDDFFPATAIEAIERGARGSAEASRLKADVKRILSLDVRLDKSDIEVNASGSTIKLSGSVPSYAARKTAEQVVMNVPGVKMVENRLAIVPKTATPPNDAEIEAYLRDALLWSPEIEPDGITISVENGRIELGGTVSSYWEKTVAEEIAGQIGGVRDVANTIAVVPTDRLMDQVIARNVVSTLELHPEIAVERLDIHVSDGSVSLSGNIPTYRLYQAALDAARYTRGVINIDDKIIVD